MSTTTTTRRTPRAPARASDGSLADDLVTSIYQPTMARLVAYFRSKGMNADEAVDLSQETVLRMLVHLRRHGRSAEDLRPLTKTIARNLLVERLRKPGTNIVSLTAADEVEAVEDGPDEQVETVERRRAVQAA